MRRTSTRLADGRELIFFDTNEAQCRDSVDERTLPPAAGDVGEIRHDPLTGDWVAIANHRSDRAHLPPSADCPLCPSGAGRHTEIPATDYEVVVFENRFPSFAGAAPDGLALTPGSDELLARRPAAGRCEVISFTADHDGSFVSLAPNRARMIVDVWAERSAELSRLAGVKQVFCFENRGMEVGVTLHHPHGQIYAYPFVTPHTRQLAANAAKHLANTGRDLLADILEAELRANERLVLAGERWTAFVPHAARWPVEIHLYPHRQIPDFSALDVDERDELALIYQALLRRMESAFGDTIPYIAAWHQPPRGQQIPTRLHLQLFSNRRGPDKLKYLAGSEAAMGAFVNDLLPEEVARVLRDAPVPTP